MGYRILYENGLGEKTAYAPKCTDWKKRLLILGIAALMLAMLIAPVRTKIVHMLIPGDPKITSEAFFQMVSDLKNGDSVKNAVTAFCETVLNNGEE